MRTCGSHRAFAALALLAAAASVPVARARAAEPDTMRAPAEEAPVAQPWSAVLDLEAILREALASGPVFAAAREAARAAEESAPAAGALQDPVVGFGFDDQPFDDFGAGKTMFTLSQVFPFPGKRGGVSGGARASANAALWRARESAREAVTEIKTDYFDLFRFEERLRTLHESRTILEDAVAASKSRYETGASGQQEMLLASVEAGLLEGEIVRTAAEAAIARKRLALLAGRAVGDSLDGETVVGLSTFDVPLDTLLTAARSARPLLRALREEAAAESAVAQSARTAWRPDLEASGAYMATPEASDEWRAELGFTVPLWKGGKQDALAHAAASRASAADLALAAGERRVAIAVIASHARLVAARESVRLTEERALPAAELAYRSARANYFAGNASFLVLLESVRKLIDVRKSRTEGIADAESELARLELACGFDVGEIRLDPNLGIEPVIEEGSDR